MCIAHLHPSLSLSLPLAYWKTNTIPNQPDASKPKQT